ncbi:MAG: phosphoribosylamine--glycine ligase [Propionibacteriaceae bacterium]|nr:phosphoribosylamine--glycine ligase [Propionibacteriaceae bacterium]
MTVLVVGSGGREHALALALALDPEVVGVHVAPGNPGTWQLSERYGIPIDSSLGLALTAMDPLDGEAVVGMAQELGASLVVIGPEAPLVAGVADRVRDAGIACFGPSAEAAQLEGSKQFAKQVMAAAGVPTARSRYCLTIEQVEDALDEFGAPYVVKNDHLAGGKGVVVTSDRDEALAHAAACGETVIEEYLDGPEVSLFAVCDGKRGLPLLPAQDFKRAGESDTGPNTGGMGAYTPLPWAPEGLVEQIMEQVIDPTLAQMRHRGTPFQGLLYAGLALTSAGLRVVEFNARFGDPETEAILPLLSSGLGQVLYAAATGTLDGIPDLEWEDSSSVVVIYAADGYPGDPRTGGRIALAPIQDASPHTQVFHCGTALDDDGDLIAHGGRVLAVAAQGDSLAAARDAAYAAVASIDFPTGFYRHDIAQRAAESAIPTPHL